MPKANKGPDDDKQPKIVQFFDKVVPKRKVGRPKKKRKSSPPNTPSDVIEIDDDTPPPAKEASTIVTAESKKKKARGTYVNWELPDNNSVLMDYVNHYVDNFGKKASEREEFIPPIMVDGDGIAPIPPDGTIRRYAAIEKERRKKLEAAKAAGDVRDADPSVFDEPLHIACMITNDGDERSTKGRGSTTTLEQQLFIAKTARYRDLNNNGISRAEVINMIMSLMGCK